MTAPSEYADARQTAQAADAWLRAGRPAARDDAVTASLLHRNVALNEALAAERARADRLEEEYHALLVAYGDLRRRLDRRAWQAVTGAALAAWAAVCLVVTTAATWWREPLAIAAVVLLAGLLVGLVVGVRP